MEADPNIDALVAYAKRLEMKIDHLHMLIGRLTEKTPTQADFEQRPLTALEKARLNTY